MSQAHRPTWNPTLGRETKAGSQQISKLSLAQHTKLKFRQPGQNNSGDILRRDLKAELAAAERAANEKKRKAAGLPPLETISSDLRLENGNGAADGGEEDEAAKRRKVLEEALEMDKDDSDDEDEGREKGKGKAVNGGDAAGDDDDEDEEEDDDDDE
jgi:protein CWC15